MEVLFGLCLLTWRVIHERLIARENFSLAITKCLTLFCIRQRGGKMCTKALYHKLGMKKGLFSAQFFQICV